MELNYLPLGNQWRGRERTLECSLPGLEKRQILSLNVLFRSTQRQIVVTTSIIALGVFNLRLIITTLLKDDVTTIYRHLVP